jgi:Cellulose biosynthesis protein BcsS
MIAAEGSYSTAFHEYYTQFEAGYALFAPESYIGPKAVLLGDQNFDQYRLGAFITGFKVGKVELGVSGGYLHDRSQGSGYFVGSDFYVRF